MKRRSVMPCYRFRFNHELPLYYYGHGDLPPPIVKIILQYGYEMTVWQDMCNLHDKLDGMLAFLRTFKHQAIDHLKAYAILKRQNSVADRISNDSSRLCHDATVNLVTAMCPPRRVIRRRRSVWLEVPTSTPAPRSQGFVLPEMSNYV